MKYIVFFYLYIIVFITGCIPKPTKKFFIRSIKASEDTRIDWYVNSSISNFAPDYLQINTHDKDPFFVSFYLTNLHFKNDTLFISLSENNYENLNESVLKGIKLSIDTTGKSWNSAISRIGRLKRVGVNMETPHFVDTYCPNGECYNIDTIPRYK